MPPSAASTPKQPTTNSQGARFGAVEAKTGEMRLSFVTSTPELRRTRLGSWEWPLELAREQICHLASTLVCAGKDRWRPERGPCAVTLRIACHRLVTRAQNTGNTCDLYATCRAEVRHLSAREGGACRAEAHRLSARESGACRAEVRHLSAREGGRPHSEISRSRTSGSGGFVR